MDTLECHVVVSSPDEEALAFFRNILSGMWCKVVEIAAPRRAVEAAADRSAALVLIDVQSGEEGYSAARDLLAVIPPEITSLFFFSKDVILPAETARVFRSGAIGFIDTSLGNEVATRQIRAHLDRARRFRQLDESYSQLQESNAYGNTEFFSHLNHELKTPMNSILGFSKVLLQEAAGPLNDRQKKYAKNILRAGEKLMEILEQVIELADTSSNAAQGTEIDFPVSEAIWSVLDLLKEKQFRHHIDVKVEISDDPCVRGEPTVFKKLIFHLLFLMMKAVPDGSSLTVASKVQGGLLAVTFVTADLTLRESGYGEPIRGVLVPSAAEFAIIRYLAERMRARFSASSVDGSSGVDVCLSLPLAQAAQQSSGGPLP